MKSSRHQIEPSYDLVAISGRFHPFHLEHLEYALKTLALGKFLYVGITNPDPSTQKADQKSSHRHLANENPFQYYERLEMIKLSLLEAGISEKRFSIVPCPMHQPEKLRAYMPKSAIQFITVYDEEPWGNRKGRRGI